MTFKSRIIAFLSYLAILFFFPLNFFKKDEFVGYHARQGVVMFILAVAITFTFWVPVLGWVCLLAYLVIWVSGIINALAGKQEPVPVVGKIAEKASVL